MQITIQVRSVYGVNKAYPACDTSKIFAMMLGTKTLTPHALRHVLALGYDVVLQSDPRIVYANPAHRTTDLPHLQLEGTW